MRSAFVKVNRVPTRVTCWGKWIEESFDEGDCKDIILMIAGNPGITGFYERFLDTIHQQTGYNVWVLSHAGHEAPQEASMLEMPQLMQHPDLYNLKGQIDHKIEFIKKYVPADCRLHLIGHSIGAYMCTNLLDDQQLQQQIQKAYLLFPTIERMATSPNGRFYVGIVQRIQAILLIMAYIFSLFPNAVRLGIAKIVMYFRSTDSIFAAPVVTLTSPNVVRLVMFLADDEMASVKQRNDAQISAHRDKILAYYGQTDGWAPIQYSEDLRRDIPGVQVELARKDFEHAYVMKHSREVGGLVADWIMAI